jgi:protein O-mannosyl-transferase
MKQFHILALILVVILGFVIYCDVFSNTFVYDDLSIISQNPAIKQLDLGKIYAISHTRFIGNLSFALNYAIGGIGVFGYHLVNVSLHIITACMVYVFLLLLTARICPHDSKNKWIALVSTLLYLVHPIQTQAVTYITQRFSVLAALFYITSLTFYLKAVETHPNQDRITRIGYYVLSLVSALCAFYTKENTYTLPLIIILLEWIWHRENRSETKNAWFRMGLYILFTVLVYWVTCFTPSGVGNPITGAQTNAISSTGGVISRIDYLRTQPAVLSTYLRLFIIPLGQNLDYDFPLVKHLWEAEFFVPVTILFLLLFVTFVFMRKNSLFVFGILFFFFSIALESSFIPIADVIAEHRMYLPSVGLCLALTSLLFSTIGKKTKIEGLNRVFQYLLWTVISILIVTFSYLTFVRNQVWKTDVTLFTDIVSKSPNKAKPLANLGAALIKSGKLDEALPYLTRSIELDGSTSFVYNDIGVIYQKKGKLEAAMDYYQKALLFEPDYPNALNNIAALYFNSNQTQNAYDTYNKVIKTHPDNPESQHGLGVSLFLLGKKQEGMAHVQKSIELDPDYAEAKLDLEKMKKLMGK